jgi:hypothetical protein
MGDAVLMATVAACWFSAGSIWLAQHNWVLFRYVGPSEFGEFHTRWLRGLFWAGLPMSLLALVGNAGQLWWRSPHASIALIAVALGLQLVTYVATAVWWGPAQNRMRYARRADGEIDPLYRALCTSNWLRVALVSTVAVLETVLLANAVR